MRLLPYPGCLPDEGNPQAAQRAATPPANSAAGADSPGTRVLFLHTAGPVAAGGLALASLRIGKDGGASGSWVLSELAGPNGFRIPSTHVRVSRNAVDAAAGNPVDVHLEIRVPSTTPPGRYTGLLQADGGDCALALFQLTVAGGSRTAPSPAQE